MIGTIKISQLPISSPLDGSENLIINQVGVTKLTTVDDVVGLVTYVSSSGISTVSQGLTGSPDINVTNINSSGIITASGGFVLGISSSGTSITSGPITELNFIGTGNTFAVTGTSVDISIQSGTVTSFAAITYGATVNLDMAALDGQYRTISLTGNLTLTTSNLATGRTVVIRIIADASQRTLTFPAGWKFLGTKPANIAASKTGVLSLTFFGTADADCVAAWGVQG